MCRVCDSSAGRPFGNVTPSCRRGSRGRTWTVLWQTLAVRIIGTVVAAVGASAIDTNRPASAVIRKWFGSPLVAEEQRVAGGQDVP